MRSTVQCMWVALTVAGLAGVGEGVSAQDPGARASVEPEDSAEAAEGTGLKVFPLPVFFYTPETGFAGGAAALITQRTEPGARPTAVSGTGIYTQNRQIILELALDAYSPGEVWHVNGYGTHQRFPNVVYNLGNRSDPDDREEYTRVGTDLRLDLDRQIRPGVYVGGGLKFGHERFRDLEGDGPLSAGVLPGADGGTVWGVAGRVTFDTRDHVFRPSRGTLTTVGARAHPAALGGDYGYTRFTADARGYITVGSAVLALRGVARVSAGSPPFGALPALGGQNLLRGYFSGRFRDRHLAAGQVEVRLPVWWRFGVAVFGAAGQVASELQGFRLDGFHPSGGAGLRFLLDPSEGVNLRVDYGVGEGGAAALYVTVIEAF